MGVNLPNFISGIITAIFYKHSEITYVNPCLHIHDFLRLSISFCLRTVSANGGPEGTDNIIISDDLDNKPLSWW